MTEGSPALRSAAAPIHNPYLESVKPYAFYALFILTLANFLNYVDRQVISIVAEAMKSDLKLTDAQLGFLFGTAFAVLYGVAGLAIGRIFDAMSRTKLLAAGLAFWSTMTIASGSAVNYGQLAAARIGVGMGEATCNPCGHALLAEYFPPKHRAGVYGALLLGTFVGMGFSLFLGGYVLQHWPAICQGLGPGACRVADWQAAFLIVGLPGLVVAALVLLLKEPPRARPSDGRSPLRIAATELAAAVPPWTLLNIYRAGGPRALARNLALLGGVVLSTGAIALATRDWAQWIAVAMGVYSIGSWAHSLSLKDRPLFKLTYGDPTFMLALAGMSLINSINGTVNIWAAPYAIRTIGISPASAGVLIGLSFAVSAGVGSVGGGLITDVWRRRDRRAPMWMAMVGLLGPIAPLVVMMTTTSAAVFIAAFFVFGILCQVWAGGAAAFAQDMTLSRMRGTASASFSLVIILVGAGMGPCLAGKISTMTGSLTTGLLSLLALAPISAVLLILAARRVRDQTPEARAARARRYGEADA